MLDIINNMSPFFEDCYRRINVREYARIMKISPPTASTILRQYSKWNLLLMNKDRNYLFFYANKESKDFIDLSRIYWRNNLENVLLAIDREITNPIVVLFGSLSKAEVKADSDIDLAIFAHEHELDLKEVENKLKRKIQIFFFKSLHDVRSKELANNIINGFLLRGRW